MGGPTERLTGPIHHSQSETGVVGYTVKSLSLASVQEPREGHEILYPIGPCLNPSESRALASQKTWSPKILKLFIVNDHHQYTMASSDNDPFYLR